MVKIIENYTIYEQIGEGEYGKVYRGIDTNTNAPVAVKVVHINKFKENRKLEQCTLNEIEILSKISCPYIVRFIEILKTANNFYFFYEFCNQGTLEQKIKKMGVIPEQAVLGYLSQIIDAFKVLTAKNIMHRDLKPGNIFFHNGQIKIGDFGFCKSLENSKDLAQTMLGSPIYMAPQILKGEIYTIKADIWSLGVLVYEMLYGYCPYEESSIARLINLLDRASPVFDQNVNPVSPIFEDFIKRMLTKDHFKRIGWEEIFQYRIGPEGLSKGYELKDTTNHIINVSRNSQFNNTRISELKPAKTGMDSVHHSISEKPRPTSECASFKRKQPQNKQNISPPASNEANLISHHAKLVRCVKTIYDVITYNFCPEITIPFCQKLLTVVQKEYEKDGLKKKCALTKELKQLNEAIFEFYDYNSVQNTSSYIQYYMNYLEKNQPRIFFQDSDKSMIIHLISLLDFNNIENSKSYEERENSTKDKLLSELTIRKGANQI